MSNVTGNTFYIVPYQDVKLGTASFLCKWRLKSIPKPKRNYAKVLNHIHLHLPRKIFPHSWACGNYLLFKRTGFS